MSGWRAKPPSSACVRAYLGVRISGRRGSQRSVQPLVMRGSERPLKWQQLSALLHVLRGSDINTPGAGADRCGLFRSASLWARSAPLPPPPLRPPPPARRAPVEPPAPVSGRPVSRRASRLLAATFDAWSLISRLLPPSAARPTPPAAAKSRSGALPLRLHKSHIAHQQPARPWPWQQQHHQSPARSRVWGTRPPWHPGLARDRLGIGRRTPSFLPRGNKGAQINRRPP